MTGAKASGSQVVRLHACWWNTPFPWRVGLCFRLLGCPYTWQVTAPSVRHPEQGAVGAVMPFLSEPQESHTAFASVACDHTGQPCQERGDHRNTSRPGSWGIVLEDGFHSHVTVMVLVRLPSSRLELLSSEVNICFLLLYHWINQTASFL